MWPFFIFRSFFSRSTRRAHQGPPPPCCEPSSADIFFFAGFFRFYLSGSSQFYYYCYHEFRRNVSYSFLFSVCVFLFELPFIIYIGSDRRLSRWRVRVDWCFSLIRSSFSTILPLRLVFFNNAVCVGETRCESNERSRALYYFYAVFFIYFFTCFALFFF